MFLILLRYVRPLAEVDAVRPQHVAFLDRCFADGALVLAGRRSPPEGGVLIARGGDVEATRRLIEQDPYVRRGVAEYELIEFQASRTAPGLEGDRAS